MELLDYTEKSIIILGEKTKELKEKLKDLGGRYNPHLTHPESKEKIAAWIFSKKNKEKLEEFVNSGGEMQVEPKVTKKASKEKVREIIEDKDDPIQRLGLKDNGHVDVKKTRKSKTITPKSLATNHEVILISSGIPEIQDIPGFSTVVPVVGMKVKYIQDNREMLLTIISTKKNGIFTFEFQASSESDVFDFVMIGKEWKQVCVREIQHLSFVH
jgi:hypothetical protein